MQSSSVQKAMMNDIEIFVKSTFSPEKNGTQILLKIEFHIIKLSLELHLLTMMQK